VKILHCTHSCDPRGGGPWEAIVQFSKEHIQSGHEVLAVTCDDPMAPWCQESQIPTIGLGPANGYGYTSKLENWLRENAGAFDCAIVHGLWQYHGFIAEKVFPKIGLPYFVFPHGMLDPWFKKQYFLKHLKKALYWKFIEHRVLSHADSVLFTCEEEMQLARDTFYPYKCNARIVPLGIEALSEGYPEIGSAFFKKYPNLENKNFLLYLSRVHLKKGLDMMLNAFLKLEECPPHLVIAGPVDCHLFEKELKAIENKISARFPEWICVWAGMIRGDLKWDALSVADAFVLPSHQENFGIAVIEALAVGTPVLITNRVNIFNEISAAEAGLVSDDTLEGVLNMLKEWMGLDHISKTQYASKAKKCFYKNYEISQAAENFLNVINEEISKRSLVA